LATYTFYPYSSVADPHKLLSGLTEAMARYLERSGKSHELPQTFSV